MARAHDSYHAREANNILFILLLPRGRHTVIDMSPAAGSLAYKDETVMIPWPRAERLSGKAELTFWIPTNRQQHGAPRESWKRGCKLGMTLLEWEPLTSGFSYDPSIEIRHCKFQKLAIWMTSVDSAYMQGDNDQ